MGTTFVFRCTEDDKTNIKTTAQAKGIDSSHLIRELLIREKIISPSGVDDTAIEF